MRAEAPSRGRSGRSPRCSRGATRACRAPSVAFAHGVAALRRPEVGDEDRRLVPSSGAELLRERVERGLAARDEEDGPAGRGEAAREASPIPDDAPVTTASPLSSRHLSVASATPPRRGSRAGSGGRSRERRDRPGGGGGRLRKDREDERRPSRVENRVRPEPVARAERRGRAPRSPSTRRANVGRRPRAVQRWGGPTTPRSKAGRRACRSVTGGVPEEARRSEKGTDRPARGLELGERVRRDPERRRARNRRDAFGPEARQEELRRRREVREEKRPADLARLVRGRAASRRASRSAARSRARGPSPRGGWPTRASRCARGPTTRSRSRPFSELENLDLAARRARARPRHRRRAGSGRARGRGRARAGRPPGAFGARRRRRRTAPAASLRSRGRTRARAPRGGPGRRDARCAWATGWRRR